MAKTLQLIFNTANDKSVTLSVDEPRADLTTPEVEATMQAIITSSVFEVNDFPLESIKSARVIDREVNYLVSE